MIKTSIKNLKIKLKIRKIREIKNRWKYVLTIIINSIIKTLTYFTKYKINKIIIYKLCKEEFKQVIIKVKLKISF